MHHLEIYAAARGKGALSLSCSPPAPPFKLHGVKECAARSNNVQNTAVAASIARPQGRPSLTFISFPTLDDAGPHGNGTLQRSQRPRTQRPLSAYVPDFLWSPESVLFNFCFFLLLWSRQSRSEMTSSCLCER